MVDMLTSSRNRRTPLIAPIQPKIIVDDLEVLKTFISSGLGLGILPGYLANARGENTSLIRVLPSIKWDSVSISFVYPRQLFVPPMVKSFMELAMKHRQRN